jgi:hypothetical protein
MGSVTSARTGRVEPGRVIRASWAAGPPEQEALSAAQGGVTAGLIAGVGLGDGLDSAEGDSLGVSAGDWVANADGDGLRWVFAPAVFEQPATANIAMAAASLIPTGN